MRGGVRHFSSAASGAFSHVKKVAVIGGGVAGLNAARALTAGGYKVVLFEAAPELGGVWRSNYSGFGLQVPRNLYEFLDFPFDAVPSWQYPTGAQVQAYIRAFAARFVAPAAEVRTSTAVEALAPRSDGARGWAVTTRAASGAPPAQPEDFDFVAVCTGMYCTPSVPTLPNDGFAGAVVHSTAFTDASAAKGKARGGAGRRKVRAGLRRGRRGRGRGVHDAPFPRELWQRPRGRLPLFFRRPPP
jgi:dimethylaniline monooxygenase (N-oxide forming)